MSEWKFSLRMLALASLSRSSVYSLSTVASRSIISFGCGASGSSWTSKMLISLLVISFSKKRSFLSMSLQRRISRVNWRWNGVASGFNYSSNQLTKNHFYSSWLVQTWEVKVRDDYVTELDQADFAQLGDALVRRLVLEEELEQAHLLTPQKRHFSSWIFVFLF